MPSPLSSLVLPSGFGDGQAEKKEEFLPCPFCILQPLSVPALLTALISPLLSLFLDARFLSPSFPPPNTLVSHLLEQIHLPSVKETIDFLVPLAKYITRHMGI